ncbi:MAG TPA: hypothetical protein VGK01_05815 [Candidatus Angelobacter sp.]
MKSPSLFSQTNFKSIGYQKCRPCSARLASFRKLIGRGPTAWPAGYQATPPRRLDAIYHHIGKNLKAGVGYNFTDFSDELTDLKYNHRGIFVNLIGTK